jgi:hypothetical protein
MNKLAILGSGCLLLVATAVFVAIRFPIGCLFVPCDRSVHFVLPREENLDGCDLLLFASDDEKLSDPLRRLTIEEHEAEVIVQPRWTEKFLVALSCEGSRLSDAELVDYAQKDSVPLHIRKPK